VNSLAAVGQYKGEAACDAAKESLFEADRNY
jgi:hypothetical protein